MELPGAIRRWYRTGLDWERFLADVRAVLKPGDTLLDAGAGECRWAAHFPECRYIGLDSEVGDPSWDYGKVQVRADLNESIPLETGSVDVILCIQVLEHLSNPQQALREMGRVLKPGGHVFLTTPFFQREHQKPHDFYRYTRHGLQHLVEQAGLTAVRIEPMGGYFMLLREQLSYAHQPSFYNHTPWLRLMSWLPRQLLKLWHLVILPPVLLLLDRLDTEQIHTLGHVTHARKAEELR